MFETWPPFLSGLSAQIIGPFRALPHENCGKRIKSMKKKMKLLLVCVLAFSLLLGLLSTTAAASGEKEGTFTVTSMNVDGLPQKILGFSINSDGPGSGGTKKISQKMAGYGWDIVGVSEDFNYNTELLSGLTSYSSGTHRGGVSGLSNNTDGLNLIWKNPLTVSGEKWTSWNTHYSTGIFNTGNGADGMIDKGYRYYAVTVAEGVTVDVYILHMDADSDAGDIAARESQLTQLADAIKASDNKNPIIVMGDTNCRYTREHLQTLFIDAINEDSRFTVQDAWIEKIREGEYPQYGADAIVAIDKGGTYDYPAAEIVDKVFYINNTDSKVQLAANSYSIATDFVDTDGTALADHWPVVVEFGYTLSGETEAVVCEHDYQVTTEIAATCTKDGSRTYTCIKCGDSYDESIPTEGHKEVTDPAKAATCTETGLTEGCHCEVCGMVLKKQETIIALDHDFVDGICVRCGEKETTEPSEGAVLGEKVNRITSGSKYVVAFSGSTGVFGMARDSSGKIVPTKLDVSSGSAVDDTLIWTLTEQSGGYTISTEIDGKTKYLGRTSSFTGYGYKVALQDSSFVWSVNQGTSSGVRFYKKASFWTTYYLRYYNASQGWIASSRSAYLNLYQVNE